MFFNKNLNHKKLRIAIITETYPPDINGVANTLYEIVKQLQKNHEVLILRPEEHYYDVKINYNLKEIFFPFIKIPFYNEVKLGIPIIQKISDSFKAFQPDIVHIITEGPLGFFSLWIAKQMNIPVIADYRTNFNDYLKFYHIQYLDEFIKIYLNYFHNQCDLNLVPTLEVKKQLLKKQYKRIKVLGRGIDTHQFNPVKYSSILRDNLNIKSDDLMFLYVGRIAPEKNLYFLCNILEKIYNKYEHVKFVFVGDGPIKSELENRYQGVIFTGKLQGEELSQIYASSDVFLFPSKTETFGNVFLESYASGLPIISYNYGAAKKIYSNHQTGFLLPLNSLNEEYLWMKYLETYIKNPELIKKHKNNILNEHKFKLHKLSWEGISNQLIRYYRNLINNKSKLFFKAS